MTVKQRILATLRGEPTDVLPYVPRLDIWYNANKAAGTLPPGFERATLRELADELELGYHAVVPNFGDMLPDGDVDIGLGLYHMRLAPWRITLHNVRRTVERLPGGITHTTYDTPKGSISTRVRYDDEMRATGVTIRPIIEHAVKSHADYPAMAYILQNAEVVPFYDEIAAFRDEFIGERGLTVAISSLSACPMHYVIKELMRIDDYFFESIDYPEETEAFYADIAPFCDKLFSAALGSPAEAVLSGANYDAAVTTPPLFERYILPALKEQAVRCHARGGFLITHTDGENTGLLPHYRAIGLDIADSVCPKPMTRLTLKETRDALPGVTVWGGVPSVSVLENSMSDLEFERMLDDLLSSIGDGSRLILSIADTVPSAAKFERVLTIAKRCREFGPVRI